MRRILGMLLAAWAGMTASFAASAEAEKIFVDRYRVALMKGDEPELARFLYAKGAPAEIVEFYRMMQAMNAGEPAARVELVPLTAAERKDASAAKEMPDGKRYRLPLAPAWRLVVARSEAGGASSTSRIFVAQHDGKLVIPVPVPAN